MFWKKSEDWRIKEEEKPAWLKMVIKIEQLTVDDKLKWTYVQGSNGFKTSYKEWELLVNTEGLTIFKGISKYSFSISNTIVELLYLTIAQKVIRLSDFIDSILNVDKE